MSRMPASRTLRYAAAAGFGALLFALTMVTLGQLAVYGKDGPVTDPIDFRGPYCAGTALDAGLDPYRIGPIQDCQRAALAVSGLRTSELHVLYAPLPPYALAPFALLAKLPFRLATEIWLAANIFAVGIAIAVVCGLSGRRPLVVSLALFASAGVASLVIAQLVPIVLAALVAAAAFARRGNVAGCALAATVAAIEPHLALPAWLGLAMFVPRTRAPLALCALALAVVSLSFGGALNGEYFNSVLPGQARAELYDFPPQYGLSPLLATFGASPLAALTFGSLSYAAMLAFGLALGSALQRRLRDAAYAVVTPAAAVLLGGTYVHGHQMAAALPLALMLLSPARASRSAYAAALFAVCALAVPWETIGELPIVVDHLPAKAAPAFAPRVPLPEPGELVTAPYIRFVQAYGQRGDGRTLTEQVLWKLPTWAALAALLYGASVLAWRNPAPVRVSPRGVSLVS